MRRVSAKIPTNISSNATTTTTDVQPPKVRDTSVDQQQQQRYGASAYIDQSEYDVYKPPPATTTTTKQDGANRGGYSNYSQTNTNDYNKTRHLYNQDANDGDDDDDDVLTKPQYTKPSTTSYPGLLGRSNSSNGLQSTQGQSRVTSAKQRNTSSGPSLYPVIISKKYFDFILFVFI